MGFVNGLVLARLCREEIKKWKRNFLMIAVISALLSIGAYFTSFAYKMPILMALLFICITSLTIVFKARVMK